LKNQIESGELDPKGKRIVIICTGHGMKDPDIITSKGVKPIKLPLDFKEVSEFILGGKK
jgi:threonine synthase